LKSIEKIQKISQTVVEKPLVAIFKSGKKWRFTYKGKHIGYYATKEEAEEARKALV
jgi:hypothetical protein